MNIRPPAGTAQVAGADLERVEVQSLQDLHAWLTAQHSQEKGIWLVTYKKRTGSKYVARTDVLDELLCFGWIDGRMLKLDEDRVMQLVTPRRVHHWSQTYKDRIAKLEMEGRMQPAGQAAIALSKSLGLWDSLAEVDALDIPAELAAALERAKLTTEFDELPAAYRRNLLRWIWLAKQPKTKETRINKIIEATLNGVRIPQM